MASRNKVVNRLRRQASIKVNVNMTPEMQGLLKGKLPGKGKENPVSKAVEQGMAEAVKKSNVAKLASDAANKAISKELGKAKAKKAPVKRKPKGPFVTTQHVDWDEKSSGPVSATMNLGVTSSRAKDRVWAAAKLFYQVVANTPLDEDYEYTRQPKKKSSKEIREKKAFKFVRGEDGLMKVVPVDVVKPAYKAFHKADEHVTRNNWILKLTTTRGTTEFKSGSLGINFDQPSDSGWTAVADQIRAVTGRYKPTDVEIVNNDPYIDVLEYGRYNSTSTEKHQGAMYQHGTVGGYSVQAPRGIMRVAASQLNNLQLDADRDNKGVISDGMLSAIPKVTLKLNSDNLADYAPVDEVVENAVRTEEENGEFISERQMGEIFMSNKPTVDVVIKKSEKAAKASNRYRFKKQEQEAKEALTKLIEAELKKNERRISQMAKQIAADARKERRRVSVGEFNRGLRGAEESFFNAEKITEQREGFTVTMKSPKTNISKNMQEKSAAKPSEYVVPDEIRQSYFFMDIKLSNTDTAKFVVKKGEQDTFAEYTGNLSSLHGEDLVKRIKQLKFKSLQKTIIDSAISERVIKANMNKMRNAFEGED
ncbi:MAG: hypothetical protein J6P28_03295 [Treponema sp.]|nr:hypothetical protein [Treponema sp.]